MEAGPTALEAVLRRDRAVVGAGLAAVTLAAWAYLVDMAVGMDAMNAMDVAQGMAMPHVRDWGAFDVLLLFVMWTVMMVAMMVPSAAPLVLTFAAASRRKGGSRVVGSAGVLFLGYLLAWVGFSMVATLAQWLLHGAALLSPMMVSTSSTFGGLLLVAAGAFQLTPLKRACLVRCRSPLSFLMSDWREGPWGTLRLGVKHGASCVGCCWALMALLFVAGVMNLLWVAALAAFVLVEKLARSGDVIGRIAGAVAIAAGLVLVVA